MRREKLVTKQRRADVVTMRLGAKPILMTKLGEVRFRGHDVATRAEVEREGGDNHAEEERHGIGCSSVRAIDANGRNTLERLLIPQGDRRQWRFDRTKILERLAEKQKPGPTSCSGHLRGHDLTVWMRMKRPQE